MDSKQRREILLVGRELSANDGLRRELQARAYKVSTAMRGEEALAKIKAHGFDLVVSENSTLGGSGLQLLKKLHLAKPTFPIILVDNHPSAQSMIEATRLGVSGCVVTPVTN